MANYRFICNHCGKSFQLETPEAKECPFCFWSSSIKREDIVAAEKQTSKHLSQGAVSGKADAKQALSGLKFLLKGAFFLALAAGVGFLGVQLYSKWTAAEKKKASNKIAITAQDIQRSEAVQSQAAAALVARLSPSEKEALYREIKLPEKIEPGAEEKKILEHTVEFKTGWSEKLPSTIWTLEQYEKMLEEQQKFYKMPFARSYKKKLEELFKTKYLPGGEAFAKGDLLQARDLWVGSLAFPLYSDDLIKHRAVALTMLKPFINDTLAKIGMLNQNLVVKERRMQEEAISREYQGLSDLIAAKKWAEAIKAIDQLKPMLDQLDAAAKQKTVPPPYPAAIAMVDQDIQRPLADLLMTNPVPTASLLNLRQNLAEKQDVLSGLTDEQIDLSMQTYRNALVMLREEKWQEAFHVFNSIHSPAILKEDARAKAAILQKIISGSLDPSRKTG